jgi:hypothetical protein
MIIKRLASVNSGGLIKKTGYEFHVFKLTFLDLVVFSRYIINNFVAG